MIRSLGCTLNRVGGILSPLLHQLRKIKEGCEFTSERFLRFSLVNKVYEEISPKRRGCLRVRSL